MSFTRVSTDECEQEPLLQKLLVKSLVVSIAFGCGQMGPVSWQKGPVSWQKGPV